MCAQNKKTDGTSRRARGLLSRLASDNRGIAAVEFALIAPLLFMLYFLTMETGLAIEANKKVGRIGSMVADLVTQQQQTSASEVDAIMKIGGAILQPYNRSLPTIKVTGISVTSTEPPKALVEWSRKLSNETASAGDVVGTEVTLPPALMMPGTFLVRVESQLLYKPVLTWSPEGKEATGLTAAFDEINMGEVYYLHPRVSTKIPCPTCNS